MQSPSPTPHVSTTQAETGRKIRRFAIIVVCVLVAGFLIVHFMKSIHANNVENETRDSATTAPLVNVITVGQAPSALPLQLPGETAAWYESTIYSRVDGYVAKWDADIGDRVKKGQVLAVIDTPDLDAQLAASEAKLKAAEALVVARQADADFAKSTYERWRDSPKGVVSEQERDAKKAGFDSAVAQLDEAHSQVGLSRADVNRYLALTEFKKVTAPYDGKITERRIDIGNLVTAGSSASTTLLYKMAQINPMRVFSEVPQSVAGDMKKGVHARISASNIAGQVFEGTVARTADAIDPQSRTLKVEIDIPNPDQALVSGMYVDVSFDIPTAGLPQVPAAALVFRSGGPEVAVVDNLNHVAFHKVTIVRDNGGTVGIGSGVKIGDRIALNISSQITDGATVDPRATGDDAKNAAGNKR